MSNFYTRGTLCTTYGTWTTALPAEARAQSSSGLRGGGAGAYIPSRSDIIRQKTNLLLL